MVIFATFIPREKRDMQRVGRSSDFQAQARLGLLAAGAKNRVAHVRQWLEIFATLENAWLQRRGRPGIAPEFPVCWLRKRSEANHQHTINTSESLSVRRV